MQKRGIEAFLVAFILGILVWIVFLFVSFLFSFLPVFESSLIIPVLIQANVVLIGFAIIAAVYISERLNVEGNTWITVALASFFCYFFSIVSGILWMFGAFTHYTFIAFLPFSYTIIGIPLTIMFIGYSLLARTMSSSSKIAHTS
jgi:hypothetical protein